MEFLWMREELIETLKDLSDEKHQHLAWVERKFPKGTDDGFDYAVDFLFDDTCLADDPEELIGYCLVDKQEAALVRSVTKAIDKLLSELGNELTDLEYISSPQWKEVLETSAKAYKFISSNKAE